MSTSIPNIDIEMYLKVYLKLIWGFSHPNKLNQVDISQHYSLLVPKSLFLLGNNCPSKDIKREFDAKRQ